MTKHETWRRQWHPTPVLLPGESHGRRSLIGCSPWGPWESDTTEQLHFHFSLSFIGGGNGSPLQYSCLENPRDGGAWWAAVYGVTQSRTQLKRLSSSTSSYYVLLSFIGICIYLHKNIYSFTYNEWNSEPLSEGCLSNITYLTYSYPLLYCIEITWWSIINNFFIGKWGYW